MLVCSGQFSSLFPSIHSAADVLDFAHRDTRGNDLLDVAIQSGDPATMEFVQGLYTEFAPDIINNWPNPEA